MKETLKLDAQVIFITRTMDDDGWYRRLADAGVRTTKSITKRTTLVIARSLGVRLRAEVKQRGLPVIDEQEAELLLSTKELTIHVEEEAQKALLSTQIARARSILDGTPDNSTWVALVKLVDETAPEQLGELIDYLDPIISRWEPRRCDLSPLDPSLIDPNFTFWERSVRAGELRVTPPSWALASLLFGADARLRLVRDIVMAQIPFKLEELEAMLDSPHLTNLRALCFGDGHDLRVSPDIYRKLPELNGTGELEILVLNSWNKKSLAALDTWASWPSVHTLGFNGHGRSPLFSSRDEEHISALYRSEFGEQITTLQVDTGVSVGYFDYALADLTADALPNLERVEVFSSSGQFLYYSLERAAKAPREIPTLALMGPIDALEESAFEALTSRRVPMYHTLDLSALSLVSSDGDPVGYLLPEEMNGDELDMEEGKARVLDLFRQRFADHFIGSPLAASVRAIHLGAMLHDEVFAARLHDAGVDVV